MSKKIVSLFMTVCVCVCSQSTVHGGDDKEDIDEPDNLYSLSAVLMDAETGRVLFEKDGYTVRANASTTKILTCILAIESGRLDELVTVSRYAASMPDVQLNINEGEKYLLKDLLYSLMLESHNDVAVAVAEHVSGDVEAFSELMNRKAEELGCTDTYFITPNGLDASKDVDGENKIHGTTASDLARIMSYCIQNETFLNITQTMSYTFSSREVVSDGSEVVGSRKFTVNNKNALLTMMDGVLSGKTGFTGDAGYCYVCAYEKDGRKYAVALLGCGWPNNKNYKWSDSKKLLAYGTEYYEKKDFFDYGLELGEMYVSDGIVGKYKDYGKNGIYADKTPSISLYVKESPLEVLCRAEEKMERVIAVRKDIKAPVHEGDIVGYVEYTMNGEVMGYYDICAAETVDKKDFMWAWRCVINKFALH